MNDDDLDEAFAWMSPPPSADDVAWADPDAVQR